LAAFSIRSIKAAGADPQSAATSNMTAMHLFIETPTSCSISQHPLVCSDSGVPHHDAVEKGRHIVEEIRGIVNPENRPKRQMCAQKQAGACILFDADPGQTHM
jgi:hypothetical protein